MSDRDLPEDEQAIVAAVAHWVDREVRPHAGRLEREQQYPAALIDQLKCAAMALTEPSGGSDVQDIRTRAVRDGSGEVHASRLLVLDAAGSIDAGRRSGLEA
jgi:alkylation response protein AidB-like acyl-CoA dehydrogenase